MIQMVFYAHYSPLDTLGRRDLMNMQNGLFLLRNLQEKSRIFANIQSGLAHSYFCCSRLRDISKRKLSRLIQIWRKCKSWGRQPFIFKLSKVMKRDEKSKFCPCP